MEIHRIHEFDLYSEEEFKKVQNNLKKHILLKSTFDEKNIKLVAGVDLAYWEKDNIQYGTCCIIVIDYINKKVVETVSSYGKIDVPYIPGFLGFRELPLIIETCNKLKCDPDIFMFDGNGYLHYNHMGIATHASFFINKPTIGIAKSYLKINSVEFEMPINKEKSFTDIKIDGEVYGRAVRSKKDIKPIFVSCGNYIDLDTSTKIVLELINNESRLPIPVRLADLETHKVREELRRGCNL